MRQSRRTGLGHPLHIASSPPEDAHANQTDAQQNHRGRFRQYAIFGFWQCLVSECTARFPADQDRWFRERVASKDFTDSAITGVIEGEAIIECSATDLEGDTVRIGRNRGTNVEYGIFVDKSAPTREKADIVTADGARDAIRDTGCDQRWRGSIGRNISHRKRPDQPTTGYYPKSADRLPPFNIKYCGREN